MTNVAATSPVTTGVLDALRDGTGRPVGDADKPAHHDTDPAALFPYAIVFVGTTSLDGDLVNPKEDGIHRVQATCVARVRAAAEAMRDRCRSILLDMVDPVAIDGHAVFMTELVADPPTFREDEQGRPATYTAITVVNLHVCPTR